MADSKISELTSYTTPLDADVLPVVDTANSITKKVTWSNVKATLKTYFDTLYLSLSGGTTTGNITLGENTGIVLDPVLSADGKYTATCSIAGTAGAALAFGQLVYMNTSAKWVLADADAVGTAGTVWLGMCILAAAGDNSATTILLQGNIRADSQFPTFTVGGAVYAGETAGAVQTTIPTGADNVIRVVGFGLTADALYFNPSMDHQTTVA